MSTMYLVLTSLPSDSLELKVVIGSCIIGKTERALGVVVDSGSETGTVRVGDVTFVCIFFKSRVALAISRHKRQIRVGGAGAYTNDASKCMRGAIFGSTSTPWF